MKLIMYRREQIKFYFGLFLIFIALYSCTSNLDQNKQQKVKRPHVSVQQHIEEMILHDLVSDRIASWNLKKTYSVYVNPNRMELNEVSMMVIEKKHPEIQHILQKHTVTSIQTDTLTLDAHHPQIITDETFSFTKEQMNRLLGIVAFSKQYVSMDKKSRVVFTGFKRGEDIELYYAYWIDVSRSKPRITKKIRLKLENLYWKGNSASVYSRGLS